MDYVIAVQTPAYTLSPNSFAVESAFAQHLVALKKEVSEHAAQIVLIAPQMSQADYLPQRHHLTVLHLETDDILFVPAYSLPLSGLGFWIRSLAPFLRVVWLLMPNAVVVHSGMSFDVRRPILACINIIAWLRRRPILFVLDIDFRHDASRYRQLGVWSSAKYLINRAVLNPFRWAQVWAAPRMCDLVLLKGDSLVEDFGRKQLHVKNFQDTVHSADQVLDGPALAQRLLWLQEMDQPLLLCYFGRLVWKKGLDRILDALSVVRQRGHDVHLQIIGDGESRDSLVAKIESLSLRPYVTIHSQVEYGDDLFGLLDTAHLCVAAPLIEDTPRAAFDALARALPILAFDIAYFRDLASASDAVALAIWPQPESLADKIALLDSDRKLLRDMAERGVRFAQANTQEIWLRRRASWTQQFLLGESTSRQSRN